MAIPGFCTVYEAAEIIGVSHAQVTRYVKNEQLPAERVGRMILIDKKALAKFQRPKVGNPQFRQQKKTRKKTA